MKNFKYKYKYKILILFIVCLSFIFSYAYCVDRIYIDKSTIIFDDGDTFSFCVDGSTTTIRMLGVDTPEVEGIYMKKNQYLGAEASEFTKKKIRKAKTISYLPYKNDLYGRLLAYVYVDDELLPLKIIQAGLGQETVSFYKKQNADKPAEFKEIDLKIKEIADEMDRPNFQNPFFWRKKNRIRE